MLELVAAESIDQERELDRLYRLPAGEFVARRNELAKRLRKAGDRDAADRVKQLAKPSQTAWAINQLALRAAAELEGLRKAGEKVRAAHLAGPKEQQAAAKARRDAISTLRVVAEVALQEAGIAPNRSHRQRLTQTLEVLSSQGSEADAPRAGRLTTDLEPAGFDALSDLAAALAAVQKTRPRVVKEAQPVAVKPDELEARPRAESATPRIVEHPAASARKAQMEAQRAAARAAARRQLERRRAEVRAQLERLEEKVEGLRQAAEDAMSELDEAKRAEANLAQAAREAERLAREARARVDVAAAATARARREAEASSAARQRAADELDQARRELP